MVRKESGTKAFVLCMVAFWLGVLCVLSMGCKATGAIQVSTVDYKDRYEIEYRWPKAKSWRKIIKEILERKKKPAPMMPPNTYPIPLYDTPDWKKMKNLA